MNRTKLFPLFPAVVALAAYANALPTSFQWDDFNVIVDYTPVHSLSGWLSDLRGGIRPLLKLSYALNWSASTSPVGFHLINNLIHALNSVLVYFLAALFADKIVPGGRSKWFALAVALVFALHPVRTEAVTYISGRSVSLMAALYLFSLLLWVEGTRRDSARLKLWASPVIFLAALLTRETAVTLPFTLLLWGVCVEGRSPLESLRRARAHFALLIVAFASAFLLGRPVVLYLQSLNDFQGASLLLRQTHGVFYLLTRWFSPGGQNIDPDLPESVPLTAFTGAEALLLFGLLAVGVWGVTKRHPAGFGALWFLLHLMPTNSLIPRYDVASERHLYLAALGLELPLAALLFRFRPAQPRIAAAILALLLTIGFIATVERNRDYLTEITLWEDTVAKSPGKARAHVNLGHAYLLAGRDAEAENRFRHALELEPGNETARTNLEALEWRRR